MNYTNSTFETLNFQAALILERGAFRITFKRHASSIVELSILSSNEMKIKASISIFFFE
jgi:hypothetical protein